MNKVTDSLVLNLFTEALREYMEDPHVTVESAYRDPVVPGSYAVRDTYGHTFLLVLKRALSIPFVPTEEIEEVDFRSWPPKPGKLSFFI